MINVSYVTTGNDTIASFRYRIAAPAQELQKHLILSSISNKASKDSNIVVFSKHWTENDWSYAKFCKLRGQSVVFDVCDDHLVGKLRDHYRRMINVADVVTCNSEEMLDSIYEKTGKLAIVIEDPVLSPRMAYDPTKPISLVWYGQSMNVQGLYEVYTEDCTTPLEVVLPSNINPPEYFNVEWVSSSNWNKNAISQVAERNSVAILPYRQGKDAKSANRVLEALQCGMLVITDPIPSVKSLGKYGISYFDKPINEILDEIKAKDWTGEMEKAQENIDKHYSVEVIAKKWAQVFEGIA